MSLKPPYRPLRPDLDKFLYAAVGQEQEGVSLTMISALARLDLDPWDEASRLSALEKPEAGAQLTETILRLTGKRWPFPEARRIADGLVELLPNRAQKREAAHASRTKASNLVAGKRFWLACLLVAAAMLLGMAAIGELQLANPAAPEPLQNVSPENFHPPVR
jgi:hypothetical protein